MVGMMLTCCPSSVSATTALMRPSESSLKSATLCFGLNCPPAASILSSQGWKMVLFVVPAGHSSKTHDKTSTLDMHLHNL